VATYADLRIFKKSQINSKNISKNGSLRIKLDTRRADENGNYAAKIVISANQRNAAISINLYLPDKAWSGDGIQRPVKAS
jgi:hypothetical protein